MNDSLNNVFLRYDRYKRQGQSKAVSQASVYVYRNYYLIDNKLIIIIVFVYFPQLFSDQYVTPFCKVLSLHIDVFVW